MRRVIWIHMAINGGVTDSCLLRICSGEPEELALELDE